jgi:hypothetical protein
MNPLLRTAIVLVREWTRFYTLHIDPACRAERLAEIESDLWEFHEDARRRGYWPSAIAVHMLARLVAGIHDDLRWRVEYERDAARFSRSSWMTGAAIGASVCIAALWALFAAASIGALPPLPDSTQVQRVYLGAMPPPPPPPPR